MDNRYYFEDKGKNQGMIIFSKEESNHFLNVYRKRVGDEIIGFNGDGNDYILEIVEAGKTAKCKVKDIKQNKSTMSCNGTVYLSMLKNEALAEVVENVTALNLKKLVLFKSSRSVANVGYEKLEKLKTISIQACKQCERATLLQIEIKSFDEVLQQIRKENCYLAYEEEKKDEEKLNVEDFSLIIGPEGGFERDEVEKFKTAGAKLIGLGDTILRAPLATVVGVTLLKGRMK